MKKVTAALLVDKGKILIAKRKEGDTLAGRWEFPGGKIEAGESAEECLKREMREEFCIEVDVGEYFDKSIYHYGHGSIELLAYWANLIEGNLKPMVHDEFRWVSFDELSRYDFAPADIPLVEKLKKDRLF